MLIYKNKMVTNKWWFLVLCLFAGQTLASSWQFEEKPKISVDYLNLFSSKSIFKSISMDIFV